MALVVDPYTATPGATIAAAEINARIAAILAQVNGNLDAANVKDASVTKAKLASDALQAFLQLATVGTRKVAFGSVATPAFGGTNRASGTITHGLGVAPVAVMMIAGTIATFGGEAADSPVTVSWFTPTTTQISYEARIASGQSNNATTIYWIAIG